MERMLFAITLLISAVAPQLYPGGEHWALHSVIPVWIDRQNLPPQGDQLVERAMNTWTKASKGTFTMRRTFLATEAGIRIHFNGADGNYGETRPHVDPKGVITAAEVNIAADAPIDVDPLTRGIIVYLTALHELGHALGLEHTRNFDDIMYLFREPGDGQRYFGNYRKLLRSADDIGSIMATGLSAHDVETLRALYAR
jgi:matrixin